MRSNPFILRRSLVLLAFAGLLVPWAAPAQEESPSDLIVVFDASGSMWGQIEGENKIVIARRVLVNLIDGLPDGQHVGLVAYGHRREGDCGDIELVTPLGPLDRDAMKATVNGLNPKGKTPITASIQQAFDVVGSSGRGAGIILVSDGLETCGGDPCKQVRLAKDQGLDFILHVVGFDVADEDVSSLECAAQAGGGQFHLAENADELGAALEGAVAQKPEDPSTGLSVKVVANGELHDAAVQTTAKATGEDTGGGRTYFSEETNPRFVPLVPGDYDVVVRVLGMNGDTERAFEVTIPEEGVVEREFDFSSGRLSVGVTRNGERSDATVAVMVAGTRKEVDRGRTYTGPNSNPARYELTPGTYDVLIKSVEIRGDERQLIEGIEVAPGGSAETAHEFSSGTLIVGTSRGGELVDSTINIVNVATGKSVAGGRTYKSESSNPKTFWVAPGEYRITVREVRGERAQIDETAVVEKGGTVEKLVTYP